MSRHLLTFLLSELQIVRVLCKRKGCGVITELALDALARKHEDGRCRGCGDTLVTGGDDGPFALLVRAVRELHDRRDQLDLEFVLPDPPRQAGPDKQP